MSINHDILTPDEINQLVRDYKDGDASAIDKLISIFDPFIKKWVSVVKYGAMNLLDPTVARYISLFNCKNTNEYIENVVKKLYNYDEEDVYNEMVILFIYTAAKYRHNSAVYFTGYLNNVFLYRVYRWVSRVVRSVDAERGCTRDDTNKLTDGSDRPGESGMSNITYENMDMHIFDALTPKERNIIVGVMINGIDKRAVANMYGITVRRIDDMISRAKQKIINKLGH